MKKILVLILSAVMTLSLCGCAGSESGNNPTSEPTPEPTPEPVLPVVIIPGIMGSELVSAEKTDSYVWPFIDLSTDFTNLSSTELLMLILTAMTNVNSLKLNDDLTQSTQIEAVRCAPVTQALLTGSNIGTLDSYKTLANSLSTAYGSENVYFFGYDFRLDLNESSAALKDFIDGICADKSVPGVNIVAHSMGGLVLASYLKNYGGNSVGKAITCGTPFYGSENAAFVLSDASAVLGEYLSKIPAGLIPEDIDIFSIFTQCAASMPSVYSMVPEESFDAEIFTAQAAEKGHLTALAIKDGLSESFSSVKYLNIAGTGLDTNAPGNVSNADGDGTVTYESASAGSSLDSFTKKFSGVSHVELVSASSCLEEILNFLG